MLRLVAFGVSKETIALLQRLLHMAVKGQLRGVVVCWWRLDGHFEVALTDAYGAQPDRALVAADLVKVAAARQLDLFA